MRSGAFHFVQNAMQMKRDGRVKFFGGGKSAAALRPGEIGDQSIEGIVLAEEQDFVLPAEVIIEIGRREVRGCGDFAHASLREAASPEFAAGGTENLESANEAAALQAGGAHGNRMALRGERVNK